MWFSLNQSNRGELTKTVGSLSETSKQQLLEENLNAKDCKTSETLSRIPVITQELAKSVLQFLARVIDNNAIKLRLKVCTKHFKV